MNYTLRGHVDIKHLVVIVSPDSKQAGIGVMGFIVLYCIVLYYSRDAIPHICCYARLKKDCWTIQSFFSASTNMM